MKNLSIISKVFAYLASVSGVLWLGGYLSRILLTYQLFQPRELLLKGYVTKENIGGIFTTLNSSVTFTLILFTAFIISYALFLLTSRISLKEQGWLLIITLIIMVTAPFEIYLMTIDFRIATGVFYESFSNDAVLQLYIKRMKALSSFPMIEIFSYLSIIFFALFRPLIKKSAK